MDGDPIPDSEYPDMDAAIEKGMPEAYRELKRVEKLGLPREGGLYDQPYHFMEELEYAERGRRHRETVKMISEKRKQQANNRGQHGALQSGP